VHLSPYCVVYILCVTTAIAGGATRSKLWLQMHSDVTGLPLRVTSSDACLLGAAVLASVGAGAHASIKEAVTAMVKVLTAYNSLDTVYMK
jgi:ribulose kinase